MSDYCMFTPSWICWVSSNLGSINYKPDSSLALYVENTTSLTWYGEERKYTLEWTAVNGTDTVKGCNITKLWFEFQTGSTAEVTHRPTGERGTNTPWGMHVPRVRGTPQHGNWHFMHPATWWIDWEEDAWPPEDLRQVGIQYLNVNTSHLDSPNHQNWNCTKVYTCNTTGDSTPQGDSETRSCSMSY